MSATEPPDTLADRTSRAAAWVSAQAACMKGASLLSQLLLARFLLREEFGLYALAMTVYTFAAMLHQAGIQEVLIKRQRSFRIWANSGFWLCLASGFVACLLTIAIAPLAARFYNSSRPDDLRRLITILAFYFPIASAGGVSRARLQIEMRFRELALLGIVQGLLDVSLKVLFAWAGYGAYSFAFGTLISGCFGLALSWYMAPVPVRWSPQFRRWRYLIGDGALVVGAGIFYWLIQEGDYIVLGRFEQEAVVGVYFLAYKISVHTMTLLTLQFSRVLFPVLSSIGPDPDRQFRAFERAARLIATVAMPVCFFMAAIADPLIKLVFEPRWHDAILLVQIMCVGLAMRTLSLPAGSMLKAQGRFRTQTIMSIIYVCLFFPVAILGTWLASAVGLSIAVAAFFSVIAVVDVAVALWPSDSVLPSLRRVFVVPMFSNLVVSAIAVFMAYAMVPTLPVGPRTLSILQIATVLVVGVPLYAVLISRLAPEVWQDGLLRVGRMMPARFRKFFPNLAPSAESRFVSDGAHMQGTADHHDPSHSGD